MALHDYHALIDAICELTALPNPHLMYENAALTVDGVDFSLIYREEAGFGNVLIYCDIGALPNRGRDAVLLRLLEINFHLFNGQHSPTFAYNAQTRRVTLAAVLMLERTTAPLVLEFLGQLADLARAWRTDYLLDAADRRVAR